MQSPLQHQSNRIWLFQPTNQTADSKNVLYRGRNEEGVWDFVKTHLKYLPVVKMQGKELVPVPERDPRILFDQMVAYYVRKGYMVPISSQDFQLGLHQNSPNGMECTFCQSRSRNTTKRNSPAHRLHRPPSLSPMRHPRFSGSGCILRNGPRHSRKFTRSLFRRHSGDGARMRWALNSPRSLNRTS